jgi:hypothetical protein
MDTGGGAMMPVTYTHAHPKGFRSGSAFTVYRRVPLWRRFLVALLQGTLIAASLGSMLILVITFMGA